MQRILRLCLVVTLLASALRLAAGAAGQPDHLVPAEDYSRHSEYRRLVYKHLLVTPGQFGRMIYEPGFYEPEWSVSVYAAGAARGAKQPRRSYRVTVTKALSSIYISLPSNNEEHKHQPILTSRKDVIIGSDLALAVQQAWRTMLSRTRPEEERFLFMDAPTVEFTLGVQRGEITPPRRGLTVEMFEIGSALAKLCDIPTTDRVAEEQKLIRRIAAFEQKARKA